MKARKNVKPKSTPVPGTAPDLQNRLRDLVQRFDYLVLFILVYLVYNTVSRMTMSGDTNPAAFLPLALILHQTVFFDAFIGAGLGPNVAYAFPQVNGHFVSLFPIVTPVLVTPVYFVSYLLYTVFSLPFDSAGIMILAKTSATIIAALSCVFVYLAGKELFSKKIALFTALVYAFATSTWSVSSQALWQHGTVELLLILMIWLIIRNERERSRNSIIFLGLLSGLFLFNRPPDAVLLLPIIGYVIWYERQNLPAYAISAAATALPFLVYNFSIFGNVFGGYKQNLVLFSFGFESLRNFAGLLIAPNVGLLIFSPVLVLSVYGYLKLSSVPSERIRRVLIVFGPVILLEILVYSFFAGWDSSVAYSYGQRFLTGLVPVLAIYTGIALNGLFIADPVTFRTRAIRSFIIILVVSSVIIQAIGVFLYPLYPDRSTSAERTWDWDHSIIFESYGYGISHVDSVTTYSFPPLPPLFHLQSGNTGEASP
ncbi:MAG: glycosyltransferase family 39 protein [Methanoregula sp.]|jgi:4-amino-4-deoxy-L-arabinose transferase-like glycosyltransferase